MEQFCKAPQLSPLAILRRIGDKLECILWHDNQTGANPLARKIEILIKLNYTRDSIVQDYIVNRKFALFIDLANLQSEEDIDLY